MSFAFTNVKNGRLAGARDPAADQLPGDVVDPRKPAPCGRQTWPACRRLTRLVVLGLIAGAVLLLPAAPACKAADAAAPTPEVASGRIERIESLASRHVDARPVDVWIPGGCDATHRCPVIYMQDGQMLFDDALTWNHQSWHLDRALSALIAARRIPPTIVVAVWNNGKYRWSEYFPQKILEAMVEPARSEFTAGLLQGRPLADAYLQFLVRELKPGIDERFPTLTDRAHTFVAGSSMGAVISVYALNEFPQVFGGAAGLSVHWAGKLEANVEIPLATFNYLQAHLAEPGGHRLYLDHGTTGLDAWYAPYQLFIDQIVAARGYTRENFASRVFEGAGHAEDDWGRRVAIPLEFLLGPLSAPNR